MRRIRIIPVLLIHEGRLLKSTKFGQYKYVGDPINAVKIFNEKEVDEICILDINASKRRMGPDIQHLQQIVSEAFMPLSYGGGISTLAQADDLFFHGVEKVVLNHSAVFNKELVSQIANKYGSQSVAVSIDYKKNWLGQNRAYTLGGSENSGVGPVELAIELEKRGAGEILLTSIERDGTYKGYDLAMLTKICRAINIPVIASGGAGDISDFRKAIDAGASAVGAGSMFVFQRPYNAVLISYPPEDALFSSEQPMERK